MKINFKKIISLMSIFVMFGLVSASGLALAATGEGTATINGVANVTVQPSQSVLYTIVLTVGASGITTTANSPTFTLPAGFTAPDSAPEALASSVTADGNWSVIASGGTCATTVASSSATSQVMTVGITGNCVSGNTITLTYQGSAPAVASAATPLLIQTGDVTGSARAPIASSPTITVAAPVPTQTVDQLAALFSLPTDVVTSNIALSHDSTGLTVTLPARTLANYAPSSGRTDFYILTLTDGADPFNYGLTNGDPQTSPASTTARGYLKLVLTSKTDVAQIVRHEADMGGGVTGNSPQLNAGITVKGAGETILNLQVLNRTTTADTAADITALDKWSSVVDGNTFVVFTLDNNSTVTVPIKIVMATNTITTPAAPSLTADDNANTVVGALTTAMEYSLDGAAYVTYNPTTFNAIDLSSNHTILVRFAAVPGVSNASDPTTLTFTTTNSTTSNVNVVGVSHGGGFYFAQPQVLGAMTARCAVGDVYDTSNGVLCSSEMSSSVCKAGDLYSTSTGAPCATVTCRAGDLYSIYTGAACESPQQNLGSSVLKNGSRGEEVIELQRLLNLKLSLGLVADGSFGPKTNAAVKQFQSANGLVADGLVGAKTKAMLSK